MIAAFLLAGGLSACSQTTLPPPAPTSAVAVCGTPSPRVEDPTGVTAPGNRLGPLIIVSGFADSGSPTPALIGAPTKVLIHPVEPFDQSITLTGARCSDGQPLRFWYGPAHQGTPFLMGPQSTPVPEAVLAQTGELSVDIEPAPKSCSSCGAGLSYTGYMLFTTTGTWRVHGQSEGRDIGEITILVGAK
jgi:hypothetical protein